MELHILLKKLPTARFRLVVAWLYVIQCKISVFGYPLLDSPVMKKMASFCETAGLDALCSKWKFASTSTKCLYPYWLITKGCSRGGSMRYCDSICLFYLFILLLAVPNSINLWIRLNFQCFWESHRVHLYGTSLTQCLKHPRHMWR